MISLAGIGVSPGVVVGPVRRIVQVKSTEPISATPREVFDALDKVASDLENAAHHIELDIAKDVLGAQVTSELFRCSSPTQSICESF